MHSSSIRNLIDGYLPRTAIREGYFNKKAWVRDDLLPCCNPDPGLKSITRLDNVRVHLDPRVQQVIEEAGLIIKFLPPYPPDYRPIELPSSVLKAWDEAPFPSHVVYSLKATTLETSFATQSSRVDAIGMRQSTFNMQLGGGYIFEGDDEALERDLEAWWDRIQFGVIFMEILWDMYWILALDLCLLSR